MSLGNTRPLVVGLILAGSVAAAGPTGGYALTAPPPVKLDTTTTPIATGPAYQTDPHVEGALVAYTSSVNAGGQIRYRDLTTGTDEAIAGGSYRDLLADVSGSRIVFQRLY